MRSSVLLIALLMGLQGTVGSNSSSASVDNISSTSTVTPALGSNTATMAPAMLIANTATAPIPTADTTTTTTPSSTSTNATTTARPTSITNSTTTAKPVSITNTTTTAGPITNTTTIATPLPSLNATTVNGTTVANSSSMSVVPATTTGTTATSSTTTPVPPLDPELESEEESRSPQTIEALLFDDESAVLKVLLKGDRIEFKIRLNLTRIGESELKLVNETNRVENNGFVKKLYVGLSSGNLSEVVDFFSILLDDNELEAERESDPEEPYPYDNEDDLESAAKIEDLHWHKSQDEFNLEPDAQQDYTLKSYSFESTDTLYQLVVSRPWHTCDPLDIQFFTPELSVWWMLVKVPGVVRAKPKPTKAPVLPMASVDNVTLGNHNESQILISSEASPNNITSSIIKTTSPNTNSAGTNSSTTTNTATASTTPTLPLISSTTPAFNTTEDQGKSLAKGVTVSPSTAAQTTSRTTTALPSTLKRHSTRKRLRFTGGIFQNSSASNESDSSWREIRNYGFQGPLSVSLIEHLRNYSLYVVLKDCGKQPLMPKRYACALNTYLDQVMLKSSLALKKNLGIEKFSEPQTGSKAPKDSITQYCPFNSGKPSAVYHAGLGKTKPRKSKGLGKDKNSATARDLSLVMFLFSLGICIY